MGDLDVLTPLINSQEPLCSQGMSVLENPDAWGRLYPENESLKIEDLVKDEYKAGRQTYGIDFQFTKEGFSINVMNHISKVHFIISREVRDARHMVFITDMSSNGTFLNGEKIGKNCRWVLSNNDKIAVIKKTNYVYSFIDNSTDIPNLPQEVRMELAVYGILGTGTFGEVRIAFNKKTAKCFALKKVKRESCVDREHTILASLQHPNIVKMDKYFESNDAVYICMEFMSSGSLQDLLMNVNKLKEDESKIILYQVARAIQYLHNRLIAHRDLKPANILLSGRHAKLADFGLSKIVTDNTHLKTFCGSLAYIAPEVFVNHKRYHKQAYAYTNKVDSWSFGVILYECLTGIKPFTGDSLELKIRHGAYEMTKSLFLNTSSGAKDLIKKLIMVDYSVRFNFDQVLDHAWFDKDIKMKRIVSNLISEYTVTNNLAKKQLNEKENMTKKLRFCSCVTHTTSSCST